MYASIFGVIISIALIAYSIYGPYYNVRPLNSPMKLSSEQPQIFQFLVEKSDEYLIEVDVVGEVSNNLQSKIYEEYGSQKNEILWTVQQNKEVIARGSSKNSLQYFGGGRTGITIGKMPGKKGTSYTLILEVNGVNTMMDAADPIVQVKLHPAKLEGLIGYFLLGVFTALVTIPLSLFFTYERYF